MQKKGRSVRRPTYRACCNRRFVEAGQGALVEKSVAAQAQPHHPQSMHRSLRAQVKREGLSTIEAVALALEGLGEDKTISDYLIDRYEELIIKPGLRLPQPS